MDKIGRKVKNGWSSVILNPSPRGRVERGATVRFAFNNPWLDDLSPDVPASLETATMPAIESLTPVQP